MVSNSELEEGRESDECQGVQIVQNQNLHRRIYVDEVMRAIIGRPTTTRPEAVRLIWNYIKRHNLQKPGHGRIILPDQRLGGLTGEPGVEFYGFKLMTHTQRPNAHP
jgi:chromatin remodeling complex protein RSC6